MSKLESLLQEFCTDGVEYKKLSEVCLRQKGMAITAGQMKELNKENGEIKIFAAGNTTANVNYGDIPDKAIITKESIIVKSRGNIGFEYYTKPFTHKNELWSYARKTANINLKFIFYYLENNIEYFQAKAKTGKLPQISTPDTDNFPVPVPPLPVQEEIARILDQFIELQNNLNKEIGKRKFQFDYYLNFLIMNCGKKIELAQVCNTIADGDHMPPPKADAGVPFITISNINQYRKIEFSNSMFVPASYYDSQDKKRTPHKGDVLYSIVGSFGIPVFIEEERPFVFQRHIAILKANYNVVNPKYLYYSMLTSDFYKQAQKAAQGAAQKTIGLSSLSKMKITVPELKEQNRIVSILDQFDILCNDTSIGLPAEIAARQTQYEYYRDKLLTFKARA